MPEDSIPFLNSKISMPFKFVTELKFSSEDTKNMKWLKNQIRYYNIDCVLGHGGTAITYKGFVSKKDRKPTSNAEVIVLKVPNITSDKFREITTKSINEELSKLYHRCKKEWYLTRERLRGCEYANPIFDLGTCNVEIVGHEHLEIPVTAQSFLKDAFSLDDYLSINENKPKPPEDQIRRDVSLLGWTGIKEPLNWIKLAKGIAEGLADIHSRRVVHGDIWPPNIFLSKNKNGEVYPIFIDFGDSFSIEPEDNHTKAVDNHPYRAPERRNRENIITKQSDVYSYGKTLLYMAIGVEPMLEPTDRGYNRRQVIKKAFEDRNPELAKSNPYIIDIICKCVSYDPVDRPSMYEVVRAFNSYIAPELNLLNQTADISKSVLELKKTWNATAKQLAKQSKGVGPVLEELVRQKIDDLNEMLQSLSKDSIILNDTREQLILALLSIFRRLDNGDKFISITSPLMWRSSALGTDGRYFTASLIAAEKGTSIQRAFIFSIQEVGIDWAEKFVSNLKDLIAKNENSIAHGLLKMLNDKISSYIVMKNHDKKIADLPTALRIDAQTQLRRVIYSYCEASLGVCKIHFNNKQFNLFDQYTGIYVGLIPVSTLSEIRSLKSEHPWAIFYYHDAQEGDKYLLTMTECVGRNSFGENEKDNAILNDFGFERSKPQLRGIMVYKSIFGAPLNSIIEMEKQFKNSVNVGGWISDLFACLPDVEEL